MANLNESILSIGGIGEKRAASLAKLGISDLRSLISAFPRRYDDRRESVTIENAVIDDYACITAMVVQTPVVSFIRKGMELTKLRAVDDTGSIEITFFNQSFVKNQLRSGESYRFYGKVGGSLRRKTMASPIFELEAAPGLITGRIVPIYKLTAGISPMIMMKSVIQGLEACGEDFPDYLPKAVLEENSLAQAKFSYHNIHFPESINALELSRRRLIFEELFVFACAIKMLGNIRKRKAGISIDITDLSEFYASLPFEPTNAQRRSVQEALSDMRSGIAMNRLIQGDVGSGKTLAAAACIWACCKCGYQSAMMAPTEILAEQHFHTLSGFLSPFGINIVLLKGSMTAKQKREVIAALRDGTADVAVGTHALLSEGVEYKNLALAVTDEQHRFGVNQRSALSEKADSPHVLVMSATPIPRTLALMMYGDLDISLIDELPPGRQKVDTRAVGEAYRARINAFIDKLTAEGRQVFVVCPMIEESENLPKNVRSAEEHAKVLAAQHRHLKVKCVHGRMKAKEKDAIMSSFARGEIDILVSTTVVEVGVDVPNAALMIIENAEYFGLSQLHQLRGRVGRGKHQSYCILLSDAQNPDTRARLDALCKTNDGFKLAEEDLRLRGPGDFFGARQHGLPEMRIADLCTDTEVFRAAHSAANKLLEADPKLKKPENAALLARLQELFDLKQKTLN